MPLFADVLEVEAILLGLEATLRDGSVVTNPAVSDPCPVFFVPRAAVLCVLSITVTVLPFIDPICKQRLSGCRRLKVPLCDCR